MIIGASALDPWNGTDLAEDSGGSESPPQQGLETSHLWLQPAFPLSVLARFPGNRVPGPSQVKIVELALSRGRRSAYPTSRWSLTASSRLVARPILGIKKSQPFYRLSAEKEIVEGTPSKLSRRACAV